MAAFRSMPFNCLQRTCLCTTFSDHLLQCDDVIGNHPKVIPSPRHGHVPSFLVRRELLTVGMEYGPVCSSPLARMDRGGVTVIPVPLCLGIEHGFLAVPIANEHAAAH